MPDKRQVAETSKEAFRKLDPDKLAETYRGIINALGVLGEATSEAIATKMKVKPDKVWKRLDELRKNDILYKPGTRKPLKSGCHGFCWALTDKGKALVSISAAPPPGKTISDFSKALNQPTPSQNIQQTLF